LWRAQQRRVVAAGERPVAQNVLLLICFLEDNRQGNMRLGNSRETTHRALAAKRVAIVIIATAFVALFGHWALAWFAVHVLGTATHYLPLYRWHSK